MAILQGSLKKHGFNAGALHGDMSQPARMETLEKFKQGEIQILVASDVAARGLDIVAMSHVFNFDVPFSPEDYVHRIGRTGRAGNTGHSFTLASPDEGGLVEAIEKLIGTTIPRVEVAGMEAAGVRAVRRTPSRSWPWTRWFCRAAASWPQRERRYVRRARRVPSASRARGSRSSSRPSVRPPPRVPSVRPGRARRGADVRIASPAQREPRPERASASRA